MNKTFITAIGTAVPPFRVSQDDVYRALSSILPMGKTERRKLKILCKMSGIEFRYSVLADYQKEAAVDFFKDGFPTTAERMQAYEKFAFPLTLQAVENLNLSPAVLKSTTHLITVSCTGMYAPGIDLEIIEHFDLNKSIERTAIQFMGCYAAFNALKTADYICRANPEAKVLLIDVELCSLHAQRTFDDDNLLAATLFADGAAAVFLEANASAPKSLCLETFHCDIEPQGKKDMAWRIGDFGFEMRLSSYIPDLLEKNLNTLITKLLAKLNLQLPDIKIFAPHPGGKKILEKIENVLEISPEKNHFSHEVLKNYGNMSSVTILFVLKSIFEQLTPAENNQKLLALAFGPGLTLESALMTTHCAEVLKS